MLSRVVYRDRTELLEYRVAIGEQQSIWRSTAGRGKVETPFVAGVRTSDAADPLAHEPKWSRWKVTIVVVVFCAAFWSGVGYIAMRLFG